MTRDRELVWGGATVVLVCALFARVVAVAVRRSDWAATARPRGHAVFLILVAVAVVACAVLLWAARARVSEGFAALVSTGVCCLAAVAAAASIAGWSLPSETVLLALAGAAVAVLVALQWSQRSMRVFVAGLVIALLVLTVKVGRDETVDAAARQARVEAVQLDQERSTAFAAVGATLDSRAASAVAAVADVDARCAAQARPSSCEGGGAVAAHEAVTEAAGVTLANAADAPPRLEGWRSDVAAFVKASPKDDVVAALGASARALFDQIGVAAEATEAEATAVTSVSASCSASLGVMTDSTPDLARTCALVPLSHERRVAVDDATRANAASACSSEALASNVTVERARSVLAAVAERDVVALVGLSGVDVEERTSTVAAAFDDGCLRLTSPAERVPALDALRTGGGRLVGEIPGFDTGRGPLSLGRLEWLALAAVAIVAYRWVEVLNNRRGVGQVTFDAMSGLSGDETKSYDALFQRHVLANVPEPGSFPGMLSSQGLTDLVEVAQPAGTALAKLFALVKGALAPVPGYRIASTYQAPPAPAKDAPATAVPGSHEVVVRINHLRVSMPTKVLTVRETSATLALRAAGYRTAAYVLDRDRTMPSWMAWTSASAEALASFDDSMLSTGEQRVTALRRAARAAPNSGLILSHLSNAVAIEGGHAEALELTLRAITRHPRYPVARYRLPIALANVAGDLEHQWTALPPANRRRVRDAIARALASCGLDGDDQLAQLDLTIAGTQGPGAAGADAAALLDLARVFFDDGTNLLARRVMLGNALRRSERREWWPKIVTGTGRHAAANWRRMNELVGLTLALRAGASGDVATIRPDDGAQAAYNVACDLALRGPAFRLDALAALEAMLDRDGSGRIGSEWARADPDLRSLAGLERFEAVVMSLNDNVQR